MSAATTSTADARADDDAPLWLTVLARAGYASRGVVYMIIGALAVMEAVSTGGQTTGSKGAIASLLHAPGGVFLIGAVALGLVGYAVWRFTQAVFDADQHGTDPRGLAVRGALLISAFTHSLLAVYAGLVAVRGSSDASEDSQAGLVASALGLPGGKFIVMAAGLCIIGAGIAHGIKSWKAGYRPRFDIDHQTMGWLDPICRFGLAARGVVFLIIGGTVIWAAWTLDPSAAGGTKEVLDLLEQQPFGIVLLAVAGAGMMAFGCYSLVEAIYRRVGLDGED